MEIPLRLLGLTLTKVEIGIISATSFLYNPWSPLRNLIDLTGTRGIIDLCIQINATVEMAIQTYQRRLHRVDTLVQIEKEILSLRSRGLSLVGGERMWKTVVDGFKVSFSSRHTWIISDITLF